MQHARREPPDVDTWLVSRRSCLLALGEEFSGFAEVLAVGDDEASAVGQFDQHVVDADADDLPAQGRRALPGDALSREAAPPVSTRSVEDIGFPGRAW